MNSERYKQVDELFQAALECVPEERRAFLDRVCANDTALRKEIEALLSSDEQASSFIESPVYEFTPELLAETGPRSVVGKNIGPYKIVKQLGSGGAGEVYLAEDIRLQRRVALKLLSSSLLSDSLARKRFLREARLASALDHPNICTIYEVGEASNRCFIAMQFVEGQTLRELVRGKPLSLDRIISITLQVAEALATAHSQGIVHRDIKPGNIIITERGQAKVLDFGLAKLLEQESGVAAEDLTQTGAVHGTPAYMSPEQARGERADQQSDIFSLGVVMYEMATGRLPFKAKSQAETMNAIINQSHQAAVELNPAVPAELSAIIDRTLAKQPGERYHSIAEMMTALRQLTSHADLFPGTAYVPSARVGLFNRFKGLVKMLSNNQERSPTGSSATSIKSIAVLPFKPIVAASRDEVLEMGMADTLITRLSNIHAISVRPMSAVRKYSNIDQDALAAGREQLVDAVLDGSVQKAGDTVRVNVRLLKVADEGVIWAGHFDEKFTDIFSLQDAISERVAGTLAVRLTGEERAQLKKRYTDNAEAYQLYLMGRYHLSRFYTAESASKGIAYFNKAIEKDPNYALPYVGLADAYIHLGESGAMPVKEAYPKAREMIVRALEKDDKLAEAHVSLAAISRDYDWNWPEAEIHFKRAIELNPNSSEARQLYGLFLAYIAGSDQAIAEAERAVELDPLSPQTNVFLGEVLYVMRRYDQAIAQLRKTLELDSNHWFAHFLLGLAYVQKGMHGQAISELQKARQLSGNRMDIVGVLGHAYALTGNRDEAQKILSELYELSKKQYVPPIAAALISIGLGDKDRAFESLEKVFEDRQWHTWLLKREPLLDLLRSDPRFTELLKRAKLNS